MKLCVMSQQSHTSINH